MRGNDLGEIIIRDVGGIENIESYTHCATRLRFKLRDIDRADTKHLREVRGILGVLVSRGLYMVVIGRGVEEVYREIRALTDGGTESVAVTTEKRSNNGVSLFLAYTTAIAGIFLTIIRIVSAWSIINVNGDVAETLAAIAGLGVYLLPVMILKTAGKATETESKCTKSVIYAPVKGKIMPLNRIRDLPIADVGYGEGAAIQPESDLFVAPVNGRVVGVSAYGNEVTLEAEEGMEVVVHIGDDTAEMHRRRFKVLTAQGERVRVGDPLIEAEKNFFDINGIDLTTSVVVTNSDKYKAVRIVGETAQEQRPLLDILS